jgi:hypothetical protein
MYTPPAPLVPATIPTSDDRPTYSEDKPCVDCKQPTPDWAAYECGLGKSLRCVGCYLKWKERKRMADDQITLSPPFLGSGGRVVRGVGSFS